MIRILIIEMMGYQQCFDQSVPVPAMPYQPFMQQPDGQYFFQHAIVNKDLKTTKMLRKTVVCVDICKVCAVRAANGI